MSRIVRWLPEPRQFEPGGCLGAAARTCTYAAPASPAPGTWDRPDRQVSPVFPDVAALRKVCRLAGGVGRGSGFISEARFILGRRVCESGLDGWVFRGRPRAPWGATLAGWSGRRGGSAPALRPGPTCAPAEAAGGAPTVAGAGPSR